MPQTKTNTRRKRKMKLDKDRHYGLLFVGTELTYVQDGIKFSPKTEEPIDEKVKVKEVKPQGEDKEEEFVCKKCGKVCASKAGLSAHSRYCKK